MNRSAALLFAATVQTCFIAQACGADLRIQIEGIRELKGHLLLSVSASDAAWDGKTAASALRKLPASGASVETVIADLPPGRYAVQVAHDANDNGDLDANLVGMPIEGYGFSNNPQVMRRATFDEAATDLPETGTTITITLN